ncbi:unnamed protein product [Onchocerca flexuosa]|uniref:Anaphase-promoting complex subunit 13 n=1 Tax=Onchocerca flexuosa TaxID=387005 RepID=A0A183HMG4_9BILA|nr:unnamed protein product [Onchocerca flexuosa]
MYRSLYWAKIKDDLKDVQQLDDLNDVQQLDDLNDVQQLDDLNDVQQLPANQRKQSKMLHNLNSFHVTAGYSNKLLGSSFYLGQRS